MGRKILSPAYCDPCPCGKVKGICVYYTGVETPNLGIKPDTNLNEVIKIIDAAQSTLTPIGITTIARAAITLTTTGTSGPATYNFVTGVLNIPVYDSTLGTATNFASNHLSPLFTTNVTSSTSSPVLNFTLSNTPAHTYFGNNTGGVTIPGHTLAGALTKVDDTNVTLTLGGNPSTSLLNSTSLTLGWNGTLSLARGGTGSALSDPGDDRILFWDDSAGVVTWLQIGSGLSITGTTISATGGGGGTYTDEQAQDAVGSILTDSSSIDFTYNDGAGTITAVVIDSYIRSLFSVGTGLSYNSTTGQFSSSITQYTDEMAQDTIATLIQSGTGITWVYNDGANTLTPTVTLAPFTTTNLAEGSNLYFTNERVDDRVATLLQAGANITLTYNDVANTLTIEGAAGGGGGTDPVVVTSSATSLTLTTTGSYIKTYVFTGSADTTWTLPALGTTAQIIKIKNRGTANITLQRAGSDQIYTNTTTTSIIILTGNAFELQDDGTYWILNG